MSNRRALIAGATGLVGGHLLRQLADDRRYATIVTLGRRQPDLSAPGIVHLDLASEIPAVDVGFCCLGTTIRKAGSREAFYAVDFELVVEVARRARQAGVDTFIAVSSLGADASSANFYLRTKGEMEAAIEQLDFSRLGLIRPSLLLGNRTELRIAEKIGQVAMRALNPFALGPLRRYRAVQADQVATALIALDNQGFHGCRIVESEEIEPLSLG